MGRELSPFEREIKKALIDRNMKQEELVQKVGTTQGYMGLILYGERAGTKYREQIVDILGMDKKWRRDTAS